jgi:hypothetical protein
MKRYARKSGKEKREERAQRGKEICIVCQKEKKGSSIKEDFVINSIRNVKKFFKVSTGNKLVVCDECKDAAQKKRQSFEKTLLTYLGLGGIILLVMVVFSLMSGGDVGQILTSILILLILVALLAALSFLNYFPSYQGYEAAKKEKKEEKKAKK